MNHATSAPATHLVALRLPEVKARTGLSQSTIYRHVAAGKFPKPFRVGDLAVAWSSQEINDWLAARAAARSPAGGSSS